MSAPASPPLRSTEGYILCTVEQPGGLALWWRAGGGYTTDVDRAGLYTEADACNRTTRDRWIPKWQVRNVERRVVIASELPS